MANPRYPQSEQRVSPRERRLEELGALTKLQGVGQEQQGLDQRAQASRMQAVLQLMQLMGEQQAQQQRAAQQSQALGLQGRELGQKDQELQLHGQDVSGRRSLAEMQALTTLAERGDPAATKALAALIPSLGQAQTGLQQAAVDQGVKGVLPAVRGLYQQGGPVGQNLAGLEPSVKPEVWNALPWDELNQGMAQPQAPKPVGSGIGGGLGSLLHAMSPRNIGAMMDVPEQVMTNAGQSFWANLLGLKPQPKDTRPFQQIAKESKAWPWQ